MRFQAVLEYVYVHEATMPLLHPARKVLACESNFKTINVAWQASEAGDSKIRGGVDFALNPLREKRTPRMARSALHWLIDICIVFYSLHFSVKKKMWEKEKDEQEKKLKIHNQYVKSTNFLISNFLLWKSIFKCFEKKIKWKNYVDF